jgi:hypothetical protein
MADEQVIAKTAAIARDRVSFFRRSMGGTPLFIVVVIIIIIIVIRVVVCLPYLRAVLRINLINKKTSMTVLTKCLSRVK